MDILGKPITSVPVVERHPSAICATILNASGSVCSVQVSEWNNVLLAVNDNTYAELLGALLAVTPTVYLSKLRAMWVCGFAGSTDLIGANSGLTQAFVAAHIRGDFANGPFLLLWRDWFRGHDETLYERLNSVRVPRQGDSGVGLEKFEYSFGEAPRMRPRVEKADNGVALPMGMLAKMRANRAQPKNTATQTENTDEASDVLKKKLAASEGAAQELREELEETKRKLADAEKNIATRLVAEAASIASDAALKQMRANFADIEAWLAPLRSGPPRRSESEATSSGGPECVCPHEEEIATLKKQLLEATIALPLERVKEEQIAERDEMIASLRAQLHSVPDEMRFNPNLVEAIEYRVRKLKRMMLSSSEREERHRINTKFGELKCLLAALVYNGNSDEESSAEE